MLIIKNRIAIIVVLTAFIPILNFSQVKIGENPSFIDANSILELESTNKVFVLTRLNTTQINTLTPLEGALVYNTDIQCVFVYNGTEWKNLCNEPNINISNTEPTINFIGDFWVNDSNNVTSIWNGTQWIAININPRRGSTDPDASITDALAGDIYVNQTNGNLFTFDGTNWTPINQTLNADNGINITSNTLQLGGSLIKPTIITTNSTNTLAIQGLEDTALNANKSVVVVDNTTGILQKTSMNTTVQQQQIVIIANEGQTQFNPPLTITNNNKIDVYRNGVRIAFTIIDPTTIEVEPEAICFQGDEIRIVQLN